MIKIHLTKKQYEALVKMVYLGNWMINGIRYRGEEIQIFEEFEQYIYSYYREAHLEKYIEYAKEYDKYFPTKEFEMNSDVEKYRQEYENENFWDELLHKLARRDFMRKYGESNIIKMSIEERIEKEHPFIEKYDDELVKNGVDRLEISDNDERGIE
ncbi:MAG: hypothetical protein ABIH22_00450 [Candidatus Margulisiibacteriota bacterium]